jgi:chromosome segregation ATPase
MSNYATNLKVLKNFNAKFRALVELEDALASAANLEQAVRDAEKARDELKAEKARFENDAKSWKKKAADAKAKAEAAEADAADHKAKADKDAADTLAAAAAEAKAIKAKAHAEADAVKKAAEAVAKAARERAHEVSADVEAKSASLANLKAKIADIKSKF